MGFSARALVLASLVAVACGACGGDGQATASDSTSEPGGGPTSAASNDDGSGSGTPATAGDDAAGSSGAADDAAGSSGGDSGGPPADAQVVPLRIEGFNIPILETYYACFEFEMQLDQLGHIVGFAPQIDQGEYVHHFVLSKLDAPSGETDGYSCFDLAGQMIWTWAPGGEEWYLPEEAGFLVGEGPGGNVTLRLQVHYNNPLAATGKVDKSGLDLYITKTLRPHDAGTMVFGDIDNISIPPGMSAYEHVATCSGNATAALLTEPMHVFGTAMHAHNIGKTLWSDVYRGGAKAYELNRDDPYNFASQHMNRVDLVIDPGDEVQTHCIYDSSSRTETTPGGPGTTQEMCWNIVTYYPEVPSPVDVCGSGS